MKQPETHFINVCDAIKVENITTKQSEHFGVHCSQFSVSERLPSRFTVAKWPTHSPTTLEVTGSRPTFSGISEIYFSNQ